MSILGSQIYIRIFFLDGENFFRRKILDPAFFISFFENGLCVHFMGWVVHVIYLYIQSMLKGYTFAENTHKLFFHIANHRWISAIHGYYIPTTIYIRPHNYGIAILCGAM